jgi:hypothetical protein
MHVPKMVKSVRQALVDVARYTGAKELRVQEFISQNNDTIMLGYR